MCDFMWCHSNRKAAQKKKKGGGGAVIVVPNKLEIKQHGRSIDDTQVEINQKMKRREDLKKITKKEHDIWLKIVLRCWGFVGIYVYTNRFCSSENLNKKEMKKIREVNMTIRKRNEFVSNGTKQSLYLLEKIAWETQKREIRLYFQCDETMKERIKKHSRYHR